MRIGSAEEVAEVEVFGKAGRPRLSLQGAMLEGEAVRRLVSAQVELVLDENFQDSAALPIVSGWACVV